jgi:hypothetical protein
MSTNSHQRGCYDDWNNVELVNGESTSCSRKYLPHYVGHIDNYLITERREVSSVLLRMLEIWVQVSSRRPVVLDYYMKTSK